MQLFAKFKKIIRKGFRATLNFWKFKVALNPLQKQTPPSAKNKMKNKYPFLVVEWKKIYSFLTINRHSRNKIQRQKKVAVLGR